MKCEVCRRYEATMKDYRDDGEKYRSCDWCNNLSTRHWYSVMYHRKPDGSSKIDPKTFYKEVIQNDN